VIARVTRLMAAEGIKLMAHRFLFIALPILVVGILAAGVFQPLLTGQKETDWSRYNSYQLFTYGAKFGVTIASYVLIIFSSMLFAGEFDRGTIKILLTRPVTRTDVFLSKALTCLALCVALYAIVLYVSFLYGVLRGDLGPVWSSDQYEIKRTAAQMRTYLLNTIAAGFLPLVGACFLGILVSNLTESSGYAVAVALILYIVLNVVTGFLPEKLQVQVFNYYLSDPFELLRRYAEGEGTLGYEPGHEKLWWKQNLHVKIPLLYIAGFLSTAYAVFRWKNVQA
jgi:ABC-type transport system involved in multi-copper enzyme maturation permease subunit